MNNFRRWRQLTPVITFLLGYIAHSIFQLSPRSSADIGQSLIKANNQFLVILVISSVTNLDRRQAIRETWAATLDPDVKLYFVLSGGGLSKEQSSEIFAENAQFSDLLVLDGIEESFHTLTLKVLQSFAWLSDEYNQLKTASTWNLTKPFSTFSFAMKCDDDSYVRVNNVLDELKSTYDNDMLYWGFFDGRAKVKKTGKYKELGWNICDNYLPYALGGGYVLASKPISFLAKNMQYWRKYQNEDTSVGAWLANLEGVHRVHDPRFDTEYLSRGCHKSYLVTHKHTAAALRKIHDHLTKTGQLCPKEYRTRLSYRYDWSAIPSKCCLRNNPNIP